MVSSGARPPRPRSARRLRARRAGAGHKRVRCPPDSGWAASLTASPGLDRPRLREFRPQTLNITSGGGPVAKFFFRSEEHTSELQSLMRISYAVFCLKKKKKQKLK